MLEPRTAATPERGAIIGEAILPETMRALILHEPGRVEMSEVAVPRPGPGEVLIRVRVATTCGTDLKAFQRGHPQIPMPGPLGHEYSGVVVAVGEGTDFRPGEAVMGVHSAPCQRCSWCLGDQENLCESIMVTKVLGSYAEYLLIPERIARLNLFHKPEGLSFEAASLLEPLACVAQGILEFGRVGALAPFRAVGKAMKLNGKASPLDTSILIIGPGAIGLMFVAALRLLGCRNVTLAGRSRGRLAAGAKLGARAVQMAEVEPYEGRGFDIVIECTGQVEVWEKTLDFVRRGGHAMLFGGCKSGTQVSWDTKRIHYDQITILSPFHFGTKAVAMARQWLLHPAMDLSALVTDRRRLEDGAAVFAELQEGIGIKVAFQP